MLESGWPCTNSWQYVCTRHEMQSTWYPVTNTLVALTRTVENCETLRQCVPVSSKQCRLVESFRKWSRRCASSAFAISPAVKFSQLQPLWPHWSTPRSQKNTAECPVLYNPWHREAGSSSANVELPTSLSWYLWHVLRWPSRTTSCKLTMRLHTNWTMGAVGIAMMRGVRKRTLVSGRLTPRACTPTAFRL